MGRAENKGVKLSSVGVDDVLKKGFGGKGWEYEQRATDVQLGFERWVLTSDQVCRLPCESNTQLIDRTPLLPEKHSHHTFEPTLLIQLKRNNFSTQNPFISVT
jgi:ATP-dependent RNA helicase DDX31/DBP7